MVNIENYECDSATIAETIEDSAVLKEYFGIARNELSKLTNDEFTIEHIMECIQDAVLVGQVAAVEEGFIHGVEAQEKLSQESISVLYDSIDLNKVDEQGYPLVVHNEERRGLLEEAVELIGMLKEGCLGVIDWNTVRIVDEEGKEHAAELSIAGIQ